MRRLLPLLLLAALLAACGGEGASKHPVAIKLIAFTPERVAIKRGETVTWTQTDASVHTVTSGRVTQTGGEVAEAPDGTFDSGQLAQDKTFAFTFDASGTFTYFCRIHPATMQGQVQVS